MGHLLKMALFGASGTLGSLEASIFKIPSNTTGTLTVRKNGVVVISIIGGSDQEILTEGDTFSASITSNRDADRGLSLISNIRGELFSGSRDAGTPGSVISGTYTALDGEVITITASYII